MTTMRHIAHIFAFALLGCNPPADIFPEPDGGITSETSTDGTTGIVPGDESGSRIRLKYRHGDDGSKVLAGISDSGLGTDCAMIAASDGVVRCLPSPLFVANYYTDAACTARLAFRYGCASDPPSYLTISEATCPLLSHVYEVGQKWNSDAVYVSSSAGCTVASLPGGDAYTLGPEVAPSAFVATVIKID